MFEISKVIKYLILADLICEASWGLVSPVFAVFVVEKIVGGNAFVAGLASAIYLILFSIFRIPIAFFLDKKRGEKDDFLAMFFGFLIGALVPFGFIFSKFPWQIYILQSIYGIAMAFAFSGYMAIFTRWIDKGKEATEWGIRASLISLVSGFMAAIGGVMVMKIGFNFTFLLVGILNLFGCLLIWLLKNEFLKK